VLSGINRLEIKFISSLISKTLRVVSYSVSYFHKLVYVALHSGDNWFLVEGAFDMASGIGSSRAILKNSDEKLICPEAHSYEDLPVVLFLFLSLM